MCWGQALCLYGLLADIGWGGVPSLVRKFPAFPAQLLACLPLFSYLSVTPNPTGSVHGNLSFLRHDLLGDGTCLLGITLDYGQLW